MRRHDERNSDRPSKNDRLPDHTAISKLYGEMEPFYEMPAPREDAFKEWVKENAERSLFFFCRWIMGFKDLAKLHEEVCSWLTDFTQTHQALLMLPVGHLKTSIVSQGMPIHISIQPRDHDLYFSPDYNGGRGANVRVVLGNENQKKAAENLSVIRETFETNSWLVWLWPDIVWDNFNDSPRWNESDLVLPRTRVVKEPSFTAFGVENAITGGHYDVILPDDIATITAGQSTTVMNRVKNWLQKSYTRLHDPFMSLHIGVGTHQSSDDVYSDWEKRRYVKVMKRSIIEDDQAIWPERYTPKVLEKLRADTDAITWALWYMNKPVNSGYSALDWTALREFRWVGKPESATEPPFALEFDETEVDERLRRHRIIMDSPLARFANDLPLEPVKGNREQMIRRFFGRSMSQETVDHLKGKYEESPASTAAKERIETILGNRR